MAIPAMPGRSGGSLGAVEAALDVQRKFMKLYGDQLEQLLSVAVYLVPVQDEEDSRVGFNCQVVDSIIDLFALYRSMLLRDPAMLPITAPRQGSGGVAGASGAHLRHARFAYALTAFSLRALRSVQVLLEMYALRVGSPQRALRMCMRVELVKLALKFGLRSQMPFSFYVDEDAIEEVENSKLRQLAEHSSTETALRQTSQAGPFVGRRSGKTLRPLADLGGVGSLLLRDRTGLSVQVAVAELLFHGRPLLHLLMLARKGPGSWATWLSALLLDVLSLGLLAPSVRPRPDTRVAAMEWAELRRRRGLLCWALARSPFFDLFFKRPCEWLDRVLSKIPIVNIFNFVELFLVRRPLYFKTSGT